MKKPAVNSPTARGVRPKPHRRRGSHAARTGPGWREGEIMISVRDSLSRHRHRGHHIRQRAVGVEAFQLRLGFQHDPMPQYWRYRTFHVIWDQVVSAVERSDGLRDLHYAERRARAGAQ